MSVRKHSPAARTHLSLYVGRGAPCRRADFGGLAEHLLLLQGHAVFTGSVAVLLIVEDGISMVDQQLVLLGRREQLSETQHRKTEQKQQKTTAITINQRNDTNMEPEQPADLTENSVERSQSPAVVLLESGSKRRSLELRQLSLVLTPAHF